MSLTGTDDPLEDPFAPAGQSMEQAWARPILCMEPHWDRRSPCGSLRSNNKTPTSFYSQSFSVVIPFPDLR